MADSSSGEKDVEPTASVSATGPPTSPILSSSNHRSSYVIKDGYLIKYPSKNKVALGPKKRYFVLEWHALKYFDNQDDFKNGKEPLKTLTISKEVVITRSESGGAPNLGKGFQLILDGQEIKLQAEMARDEEDWIEKIRGRKLVLKASSSRLGSGSGEAVSSKRPFSLKTHDEAPDTLAVLGAGGAVGLASVKAIVSKLSASPSINEKLRAITRDPASLEAALEGTVDLGSLTIVEGDMSQPESLAEALADVDYLFVVVPGTEDRVTLVKNAISAAKDAGVNFLLIISSTTVGLATTIMGQPFSQIEAEIRAADIPYSTIRCPLFMENLLSHRLSISTQDRFFLPVNPDKLFSTIAAEDIAFAAATILTNPAPHVMKTYNLAAPPLTAKSLAATFSKVLERPIKEERVTYAQAKSTLLSMGFWEWAIDGMLEVYRLADVDSPCAFVRHSDFQGLTGRPAVDVESWLALRRACFEAALDNSGSAILTLPNVDPLPTPSYDSARPISPLSDTVREADVATAAGDPSASQAGATQSGDKEAQGIGQSKSGGKKADTRRSDATSHEQRARAVKATRACCTIA